MTCTNFGTPNMAKFSWIMHLVGCLIQKIFLLTYCESLDGLGLKSLSSSLIRLRDFLIKSSTPRSRSLIRLSSELELDNDNRPLDSRFILSEALLAAALLNRFPFPLLLFFPDFLFLYGGEDDVVIRLFLDIIDGDGDFVFDFDFEWSLWSDF